MLRNLICSRFDVTAGFNVILIITASKSSISYFRLFKIMVFEFQALKAG